MSQIDVRVANRTCEAEGICSYELVTLDGAPLPAFEAGAHVDVHVGEGLVRQYSLCNAPGETHRYLIGVLRDPASRGGSQAMHERIECGARLTISAPKNHFGLVEAPHSVLLAGGIGVTPILAMAESLSGRGASFELHYSARSPERAAFRERIGAAPFAGQAHFHFDDARRLDMAALLAGLAPDSHLYVCGPAGFIDYVLGTAREKGWPEAQLHVEHFAGAAVDTSTDGAFEVKLASSGKVIPVAADRSVLQVLNENGIDVPYSCESGVCGTCLVRVLDGVPDHRDMYLTDEEHDANDQFTPCCSRAKSRVLVLDL